MLHCGAWNVSVLVEKAVDELEHGDALQLTRAQSDGADVACDTLLIADPVLLVRVIHRQNNRFDHLVKAWIWETSHTRLIHHLPDSHRLEH
jgi:hypothetical protein